MSTAVLRGTGTFDERLKCLVNFIMENKLSQKKLDSENCKYLGIKVDMERREQAAKLQDMVAEFWKTKENEQIKNIPSLYDELRRKRQVCITIIVLLLHYIIFLL